MTNMDNQDRHENAANAPNAEGESEILTSALEGADAEALWILQNLGSLKHLMGRLLNMTRRINNRLSRNAPSFSEIEDVPPSGTPSHEPSQLGADTLYHYEPGPGIRATRTNAND